MPKKLREHFLDIERQLVQHLIWKKDTPVVKHIENMIENQNKENSGTVDKSKMGVTMGEIERRNE